jgi:hypothetical protein
LDIPIQIHSSDQFLEDSKDWVEVVVVVVGEEEDWDIPI